jgi:hypothetical protein
MIGDPVTDNDDSLADDDADDQESDGNPDNQFIDDAYRPLIPSRRALAVLLGNVDKETSPRTGRAVILRFNKARMSAS